MIDSRQFIIKKEAIEREGWLSIPLNCGLTLSYHHGLCVTANEVASVVLLGHAWQVLPSEPSPAELVSIDLGDKPLKQVFEMEQSWCGRYVLIYNNLLLLDNCGILGVFYSEETISSSIRLLCEAEGRPVVVPPIRFGQSPNFIPGPLTTYEGVLRLLPSQILNITSLQVSLRPLIPFGITSYPSEQHRLDSFVTMFTTSLRNMQSHFPKSQIWLALTGGVDSRVVMSLMEASGVKYKTFTAWHERISEGDKDIPPHLAMTLGKEHRFLQRKDFSQKNYDEYTDHTAGYATDQDRNFWAYGQYPQLLDEDQDVLIVRNSIWECADDHYRHYTDPLDIWRLYPYANMQQKQSIEQWEAIVVTDTYNKDINSWTRLFWEQREGCWLSSLEQGYDMMDGITSVQACNCRLFMSILMGFDEKERFLKIHEKKIMRQLYPILLTLPFSTRYNGFSLKQGISFCEKMKYFFSYSKKRAIQSAKRLAKKVIGRK